MTSVTAPHPASAAIEFRVRYAETDQMKVVYHANYLVWCEIGRTHLMRSLGTSYAELERGGVALAVVDASLRYHASARYDDLIRVVTSLASVRSRTVTFDYRIHDAESGQKLVSAQTTLASVNPAGKLVALPDDLRRKLENAVA